MLPWLWREIEQRRRRSLLPGSRTNRDDATPEGVYHDVAARFLDVQIATDDILDNKTANAFSVGSTVLPLTFGLLSFASTDVPTTAVALLGSALFAYFVLLVCAGRASFIRGFEYRPDIPTLDIHSRTFPVDALQRWVADEYTASIRVNKLALICKARRVGAATAALYAEGLLLSLAAIATLLL